MTAGANPMAIKRGVDLAVEAAIGSIADQAKKVKGTADLRNVATVSAELSNGPPRLLPPFRM